MAKKNVDLFGGPTYYTPKYSGGPLEALAQYQAAVQKVDPKYNLGMGIYSPGMENKSRQTNDLINMFLGTRAGAKDAAIGRPMSQNQYTMKLGSHYTDPSQSQLADLARLNQARTDKSRYAALSDLQKFTSGLEKAGGSEADARAGLYQQLSQHPGDETKNLKGAFADTSVGREQAIHATPQWQMSEIYNTYLQPMVNQQIQSMYDTAAKLQAYYNTPSKYRTRAFPEGKPSTRGLTKYITGAITPDSIVQAAQDMSTPKGQEQYITDYLATQAKQRGTQANQLNQLTATLPKGQQALPPDPNLDPSTNAYYQYIWNALHGGEIGYKQPKAGSTVQTFAQQLANVPTGNSLRPGQSAPGYP